MVYGVGCDLCEIARVAKSLDGAHAETFLQRAYGKQEQQLLFNGEKLRPDSAAADFAAKEAFLKATGNGLGAFALSEIEALRHPSGAPYYAFCGKAAQYMQKNKLSAKLSLSHEAGCAMAVCILEKQE